MSKATPPGDTKALEAAPAYTPDELAQFIVSSTAVFDGDPPAEIAAHAKDCVDKAPK